MQVIFTHLYCEIDKNNTVCPEVIGSRDASIIIIEQTNQKKWRKLWHVFKHNKYIRKPKTSNHHRGLQHETKARPPRFLVCAKNHFTLCALLLLYFFLGLDSKLYCGECSSHSLLLLCLLGSLSLGQRSSHSPCLLRSQILGHVLRRGTGLAQSLLLLLVVHSQDAGNRLANRLNLGNFGGSTVSDFGNVQFRQLLAKISQGLEEILLGHVSQFVGFNHFETSLFQSAEGGGK